jgi:hypothetical protein
LFKTFKPAFSTWTNKKITLELKNKWVVHDLCKERHGAIQTPLKPYFAGPGQPFWQVSQYLGRKSLAGHYLDWETWESPKNATRQPIFIAKHQIFTVNRYLPYIL